MSNTIIEALFEYFDECPLMEGGRLNVDYLPEDTKAAGVEYAIGAEPADDVVKTYLDGGAECRYPFIISSVNDYGPDVAQSIANSGFYERLAEWLRKQRRIRNLPVLPDGMMPEGIRALGPGYLYQPDIDAGKYQIQCELKYYRRGGF